MTAAALKQEGNSFARAIGRCNAALLAVTFAWPFLLYAVLVPFGAPGIAAMVVSLFLKPVIFLIFVVCVVAICKRRLRAVGLSNWWLVGLALMLLAGTQFWMAASAPWSVGFSIGYMGGVPSTAATAFAALAALCFAPTNVEPAWSNSKYLKFFFSGLVVATMLQVAEQLLLYFTVNYSLMHAANTASFFASPFMYAAPIICALLGYRWWMENGRTGLATRAHSIVSAMTWFVLVSALVLTVVNAAMIPVYLTGVRLDSLARVFQIIDMVRPLQLVVLMLLPLAIGKMLADGNPTKAGET
jgi:uncharacterized membrane protein YhaH (DUF805 family)